jgi:hypothetical protein
MGEFSQSEIDGTDHHETGGDATNRELARQLVEARAQLAAKARRVEELEAVAAGHHYVAGMAEAGEELTEQELEREQLDHAETIKELRATEAQLAAKTAECGKLGDDIVGWFQTQAEMQRIIDAKTAECERLRAGLGLDRTWPLLDVLAKLADGVEHLFDDHDCAGHGWEEYSRAAKEARLIIASTASHTPMTGAQLAARHGFEPQPARCAYCGHPANSSDCQKAHP